MAIPPVVSNFPALNVYKSNQASARAAASESNSRAGEPQDLVEISSAALEQLQGDQHLADEQEAGEVAQQTRQILQGSEFDLGLNSDFS